MASQHAGAKGIAGAAGTCRVRRESWGLIYVNQCLLSTKGTKGTKGTKKSPQRAGGGKARGGERDGWGMGG